MLLWVSARGYFSVYRLVRMLKSEEKTIILTPYFIFSIRGTTRTLKAALIIRQLGARRNFFQDVISNQTVVCSIIEIQCNGTMQQKVPLRKFATCAKMIVKTTLPCRRVKNGFQFIQ